MKPAQAAEEEPVVPTLCWQRAPPSWVRESQRNPENKDRGGLGLPAALSLRSLCHFKMFACFRFGKLAKQHFQGLLSKKLDTGWVCECFYRGDEILADQFVVLRMNTISQHGIHLVLFMQNPATEYNKDNPTPVLSHTCEYRWPLWCCCWASGFTVLLSRTTKWNANRLSLWASWLMS